MSCNLNLSCFPHYFLCLLKLKILKVNESLQMLNFVMSLVEILSHHYDFNLMLIDDDICQGLDLDQLEGLKKGFEGFDKEGSGTITQTTMQMILKSMGVKLEKDEFESAAQVESYQQEFCNMNLFLILPYINLNMIDQQSLLFLLLS